MAAPLSQDLRRRLVQAVESGSSAREAARRFAVSESAAIKLVRRVRETGSTQPARIGGYRKPLLAGHEDLLRELTATKGHITLTEIQAALVARGIEAGCLTTIWSTLRRLGLSHKKHAEGRRAGPARRCRPPPALAILAAVHGPGAVRVHRRDRRQHEHDPALRLGASERTPGRCRAARALAHDDIRGRAEPVKVPPAKQVEYRRRVRSTGLVAPLVLDGPMNGSAFLAYVQQFLAPTLRPGDVVVMDNLSAHKVTGVEDAIRATGASLLYLPPYSPDLNPIEQVFAKLKALLRGAAARTKETLWTTIGQLIGRFKPDECRNYLTNSGYEFT